MESSNGYEMIEKVAEESGRFKPAAFLFVLRSIEHCRRRLARSGHVTGSELVESVRQLALTEYGPTSKLVLNDWGIHRTEDIGTLVFLMVEHQLLSRTEEDTIGDFADGFDFDVEFVQKYRW